MNNLPAYLAGESVLPHRRRDPAAGPLIGTNIGPLAAPWASLATLLWFERCRAAGVAVPVTRFVLTSTCSRSPARSARSARCCWLS